jgi:hypothetical protein
VGCDGVKQSQHCPSRLESSTIAVRQQERSSYAESLIFVNGVGRSFARL